MPDRHRDRFCLTASQVDAVRKFYRGPTDRHGDSLFNGGQPYGSELGWRGAFVGSAADTAAPGDTFDATMALQYLKYIAFIPNPASTFTLADVQFTDSEFRKLNRLGDAIYPDLRAFKTHGGRLILYHGWADQAVSPYSAIDYYAAVERIMGGFAASQLALGQGEALITKRVVLRNENDRRWHAGEISVQRAELAQRTCVQVWGPLEDEPGQG